MLHADMTAKNEEVAIVYNESVKIFVFIPIKFNMYVLTVYSINFHHQVIIFNCSSQAD